VLALVAALVALLTGPAAAATSAAPVRSVAVLAGPAPSPSPSVTDPGIGLGPGAPTDAPTAPVPITTTDPGTGGEADPSWYDIPGQIQKAIDDWFGQIVADAMTPMLTLLGSTLLGTPDVTAMPRVRALWTQMALLANACYLLLVLAGAVIVTTHGTAQSRHSAKEIVPRLLVGMVAGNASIAVLALMIHLADALAEAILGSGIDPSTAGAALGHMLSGGNGIFLILLDLGAQVMLIAIALTYIVRVALTVILAVAAPLALSLHALPQTDGFARLWWRAITGCFVIQLGQSLTFVVALDVMLDPSASVSLFGMPNGSALVDVLVFLALCWILIKIPSWVSRSIFGARSSTLGRMAKAVIAYKTLGAFGLKRGPGGIPMRTGSAPHRPRPGASGAPWSGSGPGRGGGGGGWGGARPGGSRGPGPTVYTVTQMHPPSASRPPHGVLSAGPRAPAGRGPRLALEAGPSATVSAESAAATVSASSGTRPPGHRQTSMPINAERAPGPPSAPQEPIRPRYVPRGLLPPAPQPKPAATNSPVTGSDSAARMSTPPRPPSRPGPATSPGTSMGAARMSAVPRAAPPPPTRSPTSPRK
jgi:hypothetical protein